MSNTFWLGMLAVPLGALAAALVWAAILFAADAYGRWNGELWFHRSHHAQDELGRASLVAHLAHARRLYRIRLFPGWALVLSRYDYIEQVNLDAVNRTEWAVFETLKSDTSDA